jgi:hypothetical protein
VSRGIRRFWRRQAICDPDELSKSQNVLVVEGTKQKTEHSGSGNAALLKVGQLSMTYVWAQVLPKPCQDHSQVSKAREFYSKH